VSTNGKILFIAPSFAGYENELIEAMENNGYEVDFFPEKRYGKLSILANKISIKLYNKLQENYLNSILNFTKNKSYNFLFVIRGELLDKEFLSKLYRQTNILKKINYQWDSVQRNKILLDTINYYDEVFSFDRKDCDEHGFKYKPLFYIEKYILNNKEPEYDLLFIGTEHGERIKYINLYKNYTKKNNLDFRVVLYISFLRFIKSKLFNSEFKNINFSDVIFQKISIKDSYKLIASSKVVLDVANLQQTGLTMRTIETIGTNRKLITNNEYLKFDSFYSDKNIRNINDKIPKDFFEIYNSKAVLKELEINEWVNEFFYN
jgi:hypothetical protein